MPKGPSNPISTTALGLLCGFMAAFAVTSLVVLVSYLRDTVKNISDVEDELNAKLFGVVYHVKGINPKLPAAKRRLSILNPLVGFEFSNSF
jgi:capsular polysaccharide biosynthesis protein